MSQDDTDKPDTSATADQWRELAEIARAEISRRAQGIKEMSMADLHLFVCCVRDGFWAEINGNSYDKKLEKAVAPFGGD